MAPLDGPMSGASYLSSSEMIASVWGVPRVGNIATAFCFSMSLRAFFAAGFGSDLSSNEISSIFWPPTPPLALMASS